jgi:hypothetical protein
MHIQKSRSMRVHKSSSSFVPKEFKKINTADDIAVLCTTRN